MMTALDLLQSLKRETMEQAGSTPPLLESDRAGTTDNANFRALANMDTLTASATLRRLRDAGLLVQKGRGSATDYVPAERVGLSALSGNPEPLNGNPSALSSNPEDSESEAARTALLDDPQQAYRALEVRR